MAVLAALDMDAQFPSRVAAVYNFGQPRLGNFALAQYINQRLELYRVVHYADIVATLPPRIFISGYVHAGTQIWYKQDMSSYK